MASTHAQDLKPCPFCGGLAFIGGAKRGKSCYCIDCRVGWSLVKRMSREEAIDTWNRRVPAPAVPDDVAAIVEMLRKATFTKGRTRGGIGGQTIEANMRSTFHEVSAWDLDQAADALEAQAAELAQVYKEKTEFAQWRREETARAEAAKAEVARLTEELAQVKGLLEEAREWNWIDFEEDRKDGIEVEIFLPELCRLDSNIIAVLAARAALNPTGD